MHLIPNNFHDITHKNTSPMNIEQGIESSSIKQVVSIDGHNTSFCNNQGLQSWML